VKVWGGWGGATGNSNGDNDNTKTLLTSPLLFVLASVVALAAARRRLTLSVFLFSRFRFFCGLSIHLAPRRSSCARTAPTGGFAARGATCATLRASGSSAAGVRSTLRGTPLVASSDAARHRDLAGPLPSA